MRYILAAPILLLGVRLIVLAEWVGGELMRQTVDQLIKRDRSAAA